MNNNIDKFFDWLAKPMNQDDIDAWYLANNINYDMSELFRDFCLSFLDLLEQTYLGDEIDSKKETKVGMNEQQKKNHFNWCLNKTVENFTKENINFKLKEDDKVFFENFFYEIFYNQNEFKIKKNIRDFFFSIFDYKNVKTKSDIEIFTELYKVLERSIK